MTTAVNNRTSEVESDTVLSSFTVFPPHSYTEASAIRTKTGPGIRRQITVECTDMTEATTAIF